MLTILNWLRSQPAWVRTAVGTFVQTAIAAIVALNLVFPSTLAQGKAEAVVFGLALLGAVVATVKAAIPDFLAWFFTLINVPVPAWLKK